MKPYLCIYHGNCADGFGAAWVVRKYHGEDKVEFHAGFYGNEPPDVTGRDVIIVDFSYKRDVMKDICRKANSVLVIDHHKTAQAEMDGLGLEFDNCCTIFNMNYSGALLTWMHYFTEKDHAPRLIQHISDRDLWKFELANTREIQSTVFSHPYDFKVWDKLVETCETSPGSLVREGTAIERKHHKDVAELVAVSRRTMNIGGHVVPVANLPYTLSSDAAGGMAEGQPFAACYMDTPNGRTFSLRSREGGIDVSDIAKMYGGGGHKQAAGFTMPIGWEGEKVNVTY